MGQLDVTVRTIYRDIATLQALGALVDGEAGHGLPAAPRFPFAASHVQRRRNGGPGPRRALGRESRRPPPRSGGRNALARIEAVLPARLRQDMEDAPLIVGPCPAVRGQDDRLVRLRRAIREQHKVLLRYRSLAGESTERVVWPFALSFFNTARIVVAWCELRQDYRSFRTDLIDEAKVLSATYPRHRSTLLHEWRAREGIPRQDAGGDP